MNGYKFSGEMKVPTRTAPPPPTSSSWSSSIFSSKATNPKGNQPKKKPPPRPPPPKFAQPRPQEKHSQLIAGLFPKSQSRLISENAGSLIDWASPPSSPTSTTRSSSDALSVNSFGSDSATPSSGAASNVESGFEDDFELYGSQNSRSSDPWSPPVAAKPVASNSKTNWVTFSPSLAKKQIMPTIIRAKPERPKFPKVLEKKVEMDALAEVFEKARAHNIPRVDDEEDGWSSDSPPMPTCPPPAPPPPELLAGLLEETILSENLRTKEQAIALFDYQGAPGDVSFRKGNHLRIIRHIDEHWVEAEINGIQGSAPVNHLQFETCDPRLVTALYSFNPETWEDLALEPGMKVRLMGRLNPEWLYGEANGKKGQFPANFVDHIPQDLPPWSINH